MGIDGRHLNVSLTVRGEFKNHKSISVIIVFCLFVCCFGGETETERHTERETERERQTQRERQTDRQTDRQTEPELCLDLNRRRLFTRLTPYRLTPTKATQGRESGQRFIELYENETE